MTQFVTIALITLLLVPSVITLGAPAMQESTASQRHSQPADLSSVKFQNSISGQQTQPQTLTITSANGSGEYVLRVTGSVAYASNSSESGDIIQGKRMSGEVGAQSSGDTDTKDVIRFTGYVAQFSAGENVTVALNGHRVPRDVLSGHYIKIVNNNQSNIQIQYEFTVTGAIGPATTVDFNGGDTISTNGSTASGTLGPNDQDAFYYSGKILRSTIDGPGRVFIDGKRVSVKTPRAPNPTITASPTSSTETPTPADSKQSPTSMRTTTPLPIGNSPFTISNLSVSSKTVTVGESVTITVRVSNNQSRRVEAPVRLATEGTIVSERSVALFPGNWQQVQFRHTFSSPGQYTIRIGETHRTIRVREPSQATGGRVEGFGLRTIMIVIVGSIVVGLGGIRLLQRFS